MGPNFEAYSEEAMLLGHWCCAHGLFLHFQGGAPTQQLIWSTLHIIVLRAEIDLQQWLRGRQAVQSQISVCIPNLPAQVLALLMLFTKPYGPNGFPSPCRSPPANIPVCMSHLVTASEFNRFWQPVCRPACSLWYPKSLEYSLLSPILSLP